MITFSNPRMTAEYDDWPFGSKKVKCKFWIEQKKSKGERVCRATENKTRTGWNKTKTLTYGSKCCIVDGDNQRTYLLVKANIYDMISIYDGTLAHVRTVFPDHPEYQTLQDLLNTRVLS